MNELVISTYIQILQEALIEHNKQEAAGSFLLDSIAKQEIANVVTDLSAKKNKPSGAQARSCSRRHKVCCIEKSCSKWSI